MTGSARRTDRPAGTRGRHCALLSATAALLLGVSTLAAPTADGARDTPRIHTPRGYSGEFATLEVRIGNSDRRTQVMICVSGRCRDGQYDGRRLWSAYAGRIKPGSRRTVLITASNRDEGALWENLVTFR